MSQTLSLPVCQSITKSDHELGAIDYVLLTYEDRFFRRKVLVSQGGTKFLVDLPQTTSLDHGDAFLLDNGELIEVHAAQEALFAVYGLRLQRLAWHIGNRHTPCQIEADRLLIKRDHVMRDMLERIGARLEEVEEPFTPEGGAYGHGRTHGHLH